MQRTPFTPAAGETYKNAGGGSFLCIRPALDTKHCAIMQNVKTGWTLKANGCGIYPDGSIDWDYSTGGHFAEEAHHGKAL